MSYFLFVSRNYNNVGTVMLQDIVAIKLDIMWESALKSILTHTHTSLFHNKVLLSLLPVSQDHPKLERS